jgi:hypothetical protein
MKERQSKQEKNVVTRRDFLKFGGVTGAAALLAGCTRSMTREPVPGNGMSKATSAWQTAVDNLNKIQTQAAVEEEEAKKNLEEAKKQATQEVGAARNQIRAEQTQASINATQDNLKSRETAVSKKETQIAKVGTFEPPNLETSAQDTPTPTPSPKPKNVKVCVVEDNSGLGSWDYAAKEAEAVREVFNEHPDVNGSVEVFSSFGSKFQDQKNCDVIFADFTITNSGINGRKGVQDYQKENGDKVVVGHAMSGPGWNQGDIADGTIDEKLGKPNLPSLRRLFGDILGQIVDP